MKAFKGFLVDIDDTLYSYEPTHQKALASTLAEIGRLTGAAADSVESNYRRARAQIHRELAGTAASHNRLLYFQRTLELLKHNSLGASHLLYAMYWDTFLREMELFPEVGTFFNLFGERPICLLTDLTADIQFRKVGSLGLESHVDFMVTSEEAGVEKPHPYMFLLALKKMGLNPSDVCMIGDNYSKDILGSLQLGIPSYWLNHKGKDEDHEEHPLITEVQSFPELIERLR